VLWTALQEAFDAARRRLVDFAQVQRRESGATPARNNRARVVRLFPWEGYGFLEAPDGHEVYFHRNSVVNEGFDRLEVGSEVRIVEEDGDKGPQASRVVLT
jgi:cold shock CspA family protein